ncbi:DUF4260 domain-containing protein [Dyadobacter subterraneus]|uniref:DUF4260 domain-containing protein n=1 Tax=Dyadobacter subterraneus TaxID=2773304 RepID=A0ABR9WIG6_9BACT|nr:DUF4260 domain-containing protein [Dyadobacter subterraneus]MBE9465290.1 DUF4260 domain-containing protein [Dyadobacter subterraneus]
MKNLLKLEEAAEWILSIFLFSKLEFPWWWYPALILLPDISMIGYVVNTKVGAVLYNLVHHKGVGITMAIIGFSLSIQPLMLAGLILFGHSCMDRLFGYGLKYNDSFQHTHLGKIGK